MRARLTGDRPGASFSADRLPAPAKSAASDRLWRRRHRRPGFGSDRFFPGLFRSDALAVWLIDGSGANSVWSSLRRAADAGWWLGFGYFVAGLWWLGAAFLAEADQFAWALPLGVFGLPAVLAVFTALGFVFARLMWSAGPARVFALAAGLSAAEWLRGFVLTGFPWNDFGMVLGGNLSWASRPRSGDCTA